MKGVIFLLFIIFSFTTVAQKDSTEVKNKKWEFINFKVRNQGKLYLHWGYNRGWYTKSDIHFKGEGFDFTLFNAVAKDRPTPFQWVDYFAIQNLTIPQTNLKAGYFISNKWSLSFGVDHMKYVMQTSRDIEIDGVVNVGSSHDGVYNNEQKYLNGGFVLFEHTDGLNYINLEGDYWTPLVNWKGKIILQNNIGIGAGFLLPKSNVTMFRTKHRDDFNVAGYGINAKTGLNLRFWDHLFLQSELKGGFINMPNIRISEDKSEGAKQHFWFAQFNWLIGFNINLTKAGK